MSVLALALKRLTLSHGTLPKGLSQRDSRKRDGERRAELSQWDVPKRCPGGTLATGGQAGRLGHLGQRGHLGRGESGTAIEERAGLAADSVPAVYLDAWARLNCQRPEGVTEADWVRALEDGGRLLDGFGHEAAEVGWTTVELFDVRRGLVWRLNGEPVAAVGTQGVRLRNGLTLGRRC